MGGFSEGESKSQSGAGPYPSLHAQLREGLRNPASSFPETQVLMSSFKPNLILQRGLTQSLLFPSPLLLKVSAPP